MVKKTLLTLVALHSLAIASQIYIDFKEVKKFPYIKYTTAWKGTPAETKDVAIPNVYIVYGINESKKILSSAARIAFFLGQWTEGIGLNPRMVKEGKIPKLLITDREVEKYKDKHLIVVGTNNKIVRELGLKFDRPSLKVIEKKGRKILIVGGKDEKDVIKAAKFLADRIIAFKAGAYSTFFNWVRVRGMIEHENFIAALDILKDPRGVHACGRNMSIVTPMMAKFPKEVKKVIKKRNGIMYGELPKALENKDKEKAKKLWRKAMITCFQCHQGIGVPKLRKFEPLADIHSRHQRIAERYGLSCKDCHYGITDYRGYEEGTVER